MSRSELRQKKFESVEEVGEYVRHTLGHQEVLFSKGPAGFDQLKIWEVCTISRSKTQTA